MHAHTKILAVIFVVACLASCGNANNHAKDQPASALTTTAGDSLSLPAPYATKAVKNFSTVVGWGDHMPTAPAGFTVSVFAKDLMSPRWIYQAPNGDIFVTEANTEDKGVTKSAAKFIGADKSGRRSGSPNLVLIFRGRTANGAPEMVDTFLQGLNQPFGMLVSNNYFYVANTDGLYRYPYKAGQTKMTAAPLKILNLPAGGYNNHWTRNIVANATGTKLYISVGSGSNVAEHGLENEVRRANILEINPDGTGERIYASGLRNPVGMGWAPGTNTLWAAVNERDNLGDDLVPDYMTSVKDGGFYGWPYSYYGNHEDPRMKDKQRPDLVQKAIVPDVPLGSHTASLGLAFYNKTTFPATYHNGAFIGQHGSWNRSQLSGYKVAFVPFKNGKPSGPPQDFLSGFIADCNKAQVYGRPVGVTVLNDGSLLVADDASNVIWRVEYKK